MRNKGPWTNIDDFEITVAEYIDWSTTYACTGRSDSSHPSCLRKSSASTTPRRLPSTCHLHQTRGDSLLANSGASAYNCRWGVR